MKLLSFIFVNRKFPGRKKNLPITRFPPQLDSWGASLLSFLANETVGFKVNYELAFIGLHMDKRYETGIPEYSALIPVTLKTDKSPD